MEYKKIAVLLPVYNGGDYLKASVESVLKQEYEDFEFIIVDDLSNDGSREWLRKLDDKRIRYFENEVNRGLFYNLNFMIDHSDAPLIKLWAQDDIMYPGCLGTFVAFHQQHPGVGFSYSKRDIIDEHGNIQPQDDEDDTPEIISTRLHARIAYYTGSIAGNIANTCISRSAINKVGLFNEQMKISADFDMWVRLAKEHETGFIKKKLIRLRDHDKQLSRNEKYYINHVKEDMEVYRYLNNYVSPVQKKEGLAILLTSKLPFYYTLMLKSVGKGNIKTGIRYLREITIFHNFFELTVAFLKLKISKPKKVTKLNATNEP